MADTIAWLIDLWVKFKIASFVHVIAFAFAIVSVVVGHVLLRKPNERLSEHTARSFHGVTRVTLYALVALVATGLYITLRGVYYEPDFLYNEKLLAKMGVVAVACINGFVMHHYVFPSIREGVVPAELPLNFQLGAGALAAVSIASWAWAALLGFAKEWSNFILMREVFAGYIGMIALVYLVALREIGRTIVLNKSWRPVFLGRPVLLHVEAPSWPVSRQERLEPQQERQERLSYEAVRKAWLLKRQEPIPQKREPG
jgi:hypothetical protein